MLSHMMNERDYLDFKDRREPLNRFGERIHLAPIVPSLTVGLLTQDLAPIVPSLTVGLLTQNFD